MIKAPGAKFRPSRRAVGAGLAAVVGACGAPGNAPAQAVASPPDGPAAFPLKRASGKRYLVDSADRPFFLHGDTAWSMIAELRREEVDLYLRDRAARGFNATLVSVIEKYHARRAPRNAYGEAPFESGDKVDFATPREAYFAHVDWCVRRANELGMLVLLTPAYLGAEGTMGGFYQEMIAAGARRMRAYGQYLGRRYAQDHNILWVLGGDYSPPEKLLVRALAEGITEGGSDGLKTAHCRAWTSALEQWAGEPWLNVDNVYTYGSLADTARKEYARPERMPFFLLESTYENEGNAATARRVRQQAYEALLSGAFGHVFGSSPMWHFSGPGTNGVVHPDWRRTLDSAGAHDMMRVRDLFKAIEWWRLAPDLDRRFLRDPGEGQDKPSGALADNGAFGLIYFPKPARVHIDLARLSSPRATARWIDPATGRTEAAEIGARENDGGHAFSPPAVHEGDGGDWILSLQAAG